MKHKYVIVGGGLAAASAIEGIRSRDTEGSILLLTRENHSPYHRPPLSKDLWFGKSTADKLPAHEPAFYSENRVELLLRREVVELDPEKHSVWDERGVEYSYERLLLATGGRPRRLNIPGADLEGVRYFRDLEDYMFFAGHQDRYQHVLVLGAGFIGMEMAAALTHAGSGGQATTQVVLAGIGIEPETDLAEAAGLDVRNGVAVDEFCRTSTADIFAAGDVAEYPDLALGKAQRVEHWDHAIQHGKCAGVNMAGADQPYPGLPFFYSDLFDLGWEAVGELQGSMETEAVWKVPNREGVVFYLSEGVTRGVLLWGVWEKVEWARGIIREGKAMTSAERRALVGG